MGKQGAAAHDIALVFRQYLKYANYVTSDISYKSAASKLDPIEFSADDVMDFAKAVNGNFSESANYWTRGIFISAAINKVIKKDETVTLELSGAEVVDCIGYGLGRGTIKVVGDVGDYVGEYMSGGEIAVMGNAGNYVGYAMSGGKISVAGNAAEHVGTYMSGGAIHIGGSLASIASSCKGMVYGKSSSSKSI